MTPYYEREEWPGFLAAIRSAPADDLPRLVAADFVEECGDAERAEFIRVQVELEKMPEMVWRNKLLHKAQWEMIRAQAEPWGERFELASPADTIGVYHYRETDTAYARLYGRMSALADGIYGPLLGPLALVGGTWEVDRGFVTRVSGPLASLRGGECRRCSSDRGGSARSIAECIHCRGTGRTSGVLGQLLKREPVAAAGIVVTDREPWTPDYGDAGLPSWWRESAWRDRGRNAYSAGNLPDDLFETMAYLCPDNRINWGEQPLNHHIGFRTADAARLALGHALYRIHGTKTHEVTV